MLKHIFTIIISCFFSFCCYQSVEAINLLKYNSCTKLQSYTFAEFFNNCYNDPIVLLDLLSVARISGYPMEAHTVETADGYILTLFHIPATKKGAPPVYLQHGFLTNAGCFLDKRKESHAYALADAGYDVWLGNVRGTTYSKGHRRLKPADPEFWDYNLDTIAHNDIPSNLYFIANYTGQAGNITYIGHSMGTMLFFMFASSRPKEAHQLIKGMIALSAVGYLDHQKSFSTIGPYHTYIRTFLKAFTLRGMFTHETIVHTFMVHFCRALPTFCQGLTETLHGEDDNQFDPRNLLIYFTNWPVAVSVDQVIHFLQIAVSKSSQMFDYGEEKNMEVYGQAKPRKYNFGNIKMPVYILYGLNDILCQLEDIERLFNELGSDQKQMIEISKENNVKYDHVAFLYSKNNSKFLFPVIIDIIKLQLGMDPQKVPDTNWNQCPASPQPHSKRLPRSGELPPTSKYTHTK